MSCSYEKFIESNENVKNFMIYVLDNDLLTKQRYCKFFEYLFTEISQNLFIGNNSFIDILQHYIINYNKGSFMLQPFMNSQSKVTKQSSISICRICRLPNKCLKLNRTKTSDKCTCYGFSDVEYDDDCCDEFALDVFLTPENVKYYLSSIFDDHVISFGVINFVFLSYVVKKKTVSFYEHFISEVKKYGFFEDGFDGDDEARVFDCYNTLITFNLFRKNTMITKNRKYLLMLFHEDALTHKRVASPTDDKKKNKMGWENSVFKNEGIVKCIAKFM